MEKITLSESGKIVRRALVPLLLVLFGNAYGQYCTPSSSNCGLSDGITNVTFAGINNTTTCTAGGGYGNYTTGTAATVVAGQSYPLSITVEEGGNEAVGFWMDYNQNQIFESSEFTYVGNTPGGTVTTSIMIPSDAVPGTTRIRIRNFYVASSGNPATIYTTTTNSSCATIGSGYGETEDYNVTVVGSTPCAGTPVVGAATSSQATACSGTSFELNATVTPLAAGLTYQWQSSADGGTTWTNLGASQSGSMYTVTGQTATTTYRLIVTCADGSTPATSAPVTITQNVFSECYCTNAIAANCADGDVITNVTIGTINYNSACGNATTGYSDYTNTVAPAELEAGTSVPVSVSVGPSGDGWLYESVGVWIDFNQNGVFDTAEYTYIGTGLNQALTANIAIPATALLGDTRMRVVVAASQASSFGSQYSCGPLVANNNFGEIEDYAVTITESLATPTFAAGKIAVYPNPSNGLVSIQLDATNELQNAEVFSITGQRIHAQQYNVAADVYALDMQHVASGVYILKLSTANGSFTQRLVRY